MLTLEVKFVRTYWDKKTECSDFVGFLENRFFFTGFHFKGIRSIDFLCLWTHVMYLI